MTQTYFIDSDDWTAISRESPEEFVREVERKYTNMPKEVRLFISLIKNGEKAGKEFAKRRYPSVNSIKPGDWIVEPYSSYLINVLRNVVKNKLEVQK
ncbi:MAG: hypothetical protein ACYCSO_05085 [Cuniculiplasma sp.]